VGKHNKVKVGEVFVLNCGVVVTVEEYVNSSEILAVDSDGYKCWCKAAHLRSGKIHWVKRTLTPFAPRWKRDSTPKRRYKLRAYKLDVGDVFATDNYGDIEVIAISDVLCDIRFMNTQAVLKGIQRSKLKYGKIKDPSLPRKSKVREKFPVGSVHKSKEHGEYEVLATTSVKDFLIKWLDNGLVVHTVAAVLYNGTVRDNTRPPAWDYLAPTPDRHYVYVVKFSDEIVYIGKGIGKRYLHVTSGTSHCKELNRLYFEGATVTVEIHKDNLSSEDALSIEKGLIVSIRPRFNTVMYANHLAG